MTQRLDEAEWHARVDRGALIASHRRSDGTLLAEGYAAREGVLEYRNADGSVRRELVPADTLRRAAGGLGRATLTLDHPDPNAYPNGVTPDNIDELGVGDTDGEVVFEDGGFVRVKMAVRRRDAIEAVQSGKRELSHGYNVRLDPTPGVHPEYGRYDAVQLERVTNHLAIVDLARAGPKVRLRADGAIATTRLDRDHPSGAERPRGATMTAGLVRLLALLGVTSRVDSDEAAIDAACDAVQKRKDAADAADRARQDAATAASTKAQADLDAMTAQRDAEKARADRAETELATLKAAEKARVDAAERTGLEELAKGLGLDPAKHADSKDLRKEIAKAHLGAEFRADGSEDYIRAACDLAKGASRGDGREAGTKAWERTTTTTPGPEQPKRPKSPSAASRQRYDQAFEQARKGAA